LCRMVFDFSYGYLRIPREGGPMPETIAPSMSPGPDDGDRATAYRMIRRVIDGDRGPARHAFRYRAAAKEAIVRIRRTAVRGGAPSRKTFGLDCKGGVIVIRTTAPGMAVAACLVILQLALAPASLAVEMNVLSERTVSGFGHPETVIYDPGRKVLYVSDFGANAELKPADKDGKGRISKVSLDGKVLEPSFLPAAGQTLNKPKGMWVDGNRLWVSDIDAVWIFDLDTKEGKKLELPGAQFANDVAEMKGALYVSDNRSDQVFSVEPADFLKSEAAPKVTVVYAGRSIHPNGIYPGVDGSLLMAGFKAMTEPRGIYSLSPGKAPERMSEDIGMLDGLYQMPDGDFLATDWRTGTLFTWTKGQGMRQLATGFKGPADFAVVPDAEGLLVVVPDLVQGDLRFVQLGK
jgi:sugar lactone lactonase YvrE